MNLIFFTDYLPLLMRTYKNACILYSLYDKFKNQEGIIVINTNEISEHLDLSLQVINNSNVLLKKIGLIEEMEDKVFKILEIKELTEELKQDILKMTKKDDYDKNTIFRKKYLETKINKDFALLLDSKQLKILMKAQDNNYSDYLTLCKNANLDYNNFKILLEREDYRVRFEKALQDIRPKEKKKGYEEKEKELVKYLYNKLVEVNRKPLEKNWWIKNYNLSRSLIEDTGYDNDKLKKLIDLSFSDKWWRDKVNNLAMIKTFAQRQQGVQVNGKSQKLVEIPSEIRSRTRELGMEITSLTEALLLRQAIQNGEDDECYIEIMKILEENNILEK